MMKRSFVAVGLLAAVAAMSFTASSADAASPFSVRFGSHGVHVRIGHGPYHHHGYHHRHFSRYGGGYYRNPYRSHYRPYDCAPRHYSRPYAGSHAHPYHRHYGHRHRYSYR